MQLLAIAIVRSIEQTQLQLGLFLVGSRIVIDRDN
jgi:hypothetical protein